VKVAARGWSAAYLIVVAAFLAAVATYYHPPFGFTAFIEFPASTHTDEIAIVQQTPHYDHTDSAGYDGQYYAQFAVEPLMRNAAIDHAMDSAPFRAHRILLSWTAYWLGLGRPFWILQVYSVQNVAAWLLLAWLLCRWMPPTSGRAFVLWSGCLLTQGMLTSVRYALTDGPSVLLLALGAVAAERDRPFWTGLAIGISGLARETNLLAVAVLGRFLRRTTRSWLVVGAGGILAMLPFALWLDYLRSVYRSLAFAGGDHIVRPLVGINYKLAATWREWHQADQRMLAVLTVMSLFALLVQSGYVLWKLIESRGRAPWALIAAPFIGLAIVMHPVVWAGYPGAFARVLLPISVGANVLLAQQDRPSWWLIAVMNLGVIPGVMMFGSAWW
jgi:hypothetical protein